MKTSPITILIVSSDILLLNNLPHRHRLFTRQLHKINPSGQIADVNGSDLSGDFLSL
jgi:hypothetical protein